MAERIVKDVFGAVLNIGDDVVYSYNQSFMKGKVVKFTHAGNVVVDNWPSWVRNPATGRYENLPTRKSLNYKPCVKINPTYLVDRPKIEVKQTER